MTGPDESSRVRVRRFDADRRDREISLEQALEAEPDRRQLIWIDLLGEVNADELGAIAKRFELDSETLRAVEDPQPRPQLAVHGAYTHVSVEVEPDGAHPRSQRWLHAVARPDIVLTRRIGNVGLLDEVDERIKSDTAIGAVEGADFVALLLDAVVTGYLEAVDDIEEDIDRLDERSLRDDRRQVLENLVRARRRISWLRRSLSRQRFLFAGLVGPELRELAGPDATKDLQQVAGRFETALSAVEASRTALLGSFDVYMTRTAQRTNEVMKALTIATVLLLPGSLVAGLLGMNVVVPLNRDDPLSFWLVVFGVVILATVVLGVARLRRWI